MLSVVVTLPSPCQEPGKIAEGRWFVLGFDRSKARGRGRWRWRELGTGDDRQAVERPREESEKGTYEVLPFVLQ